MDKIEPLSLGEKVDFYARLLFCVPPVVIREVIKTLITATKRGLPYKEYLVATVIRIQLTCFTERQQLSLSNTNTSQRYEQWIEKEAKAHNVSPIKDTVVLADGSAKLHWIRKTGDKSPKVALVFHGGGYYLPPGNGHLNVYAHIVNASCSTTKTVAVAMLEYDYTTQSKYPRQLQQASLALQHLLQLGYEPGDIFIGGDSAGGHLTVTLLSHLMHKHPSVPSVNLSGPLAGAFMISPWVSGEDSTVSFRENAWTDMLAHQTIVPNAAFLIPYHIRQAEAENKQGWAMALVADEDWWLTLPEVVSNIHITAGEHEIFRDHVVMLADIMRKKAPKCRIQSEVGVGEQHVHMVLWNMVQAPENPALRRLEEWFVTILQE
ncbi:alpha/beta-hydrolase, partial [Aureobasidium melanogenum]